MMLNIEKTTFHFYINNKLTLQAAILTNDMRLKKIIKILFLVYFVYKKEL